MNDQFRRILDLVRRTGDTLVVTDPSGEDVFVVMDIEQYEMMLGMQEGDDTEESKESTKDGEADIWQTMKPAGAQGETWDLDQMNEKELADLEEQYRQFAQRNVKEVIDTAKPAKDIPIEPKKPDLDDFGEEAFYLEPVE